MNKILHSLQSLWLLKTDCARIDAFHCACLRKILRIPHSFISRIPNDIVLERANENKLSFLLGERQIALLMKIQTLPFDDCLRKLVCDINGQPIRWHRRRHLGRPKQNWTNSVCEKLVMIMSWRSCPEAMCRPLPLPTRRSDVRLVCVWVMGWNSPGCRKRSAALR